MRHERHHAIHDGEHPEECDDIPHWELCVARKGADTCSESAAPPRMCALPRECRAGEDKEHRREAYDGLEQVGAADDYGGAALNEHLPLRIKR